MLMHFFMLFHFFNIKEAILGWYAISVITLICYIITFSRRLYFSSHSHLLSLPMLYTQQSLRGYATTVSEDEDSALEYAGMYPNVPVSMS